MRSYETMFVIRPDLDEEGTERTIEKFTGLIQEQGGQVEELERWGKRRLAYEIQGYNEGYYVVIDFKAPGSTVTELNRVMRISDEVIRHMVVKEGE